MEKPRHGRVAREEATSVAETRELAAQGQGGHTEVRGSRQSWGQRKGPEVGLVSPSPGSVVWREHSGQAAGGFREPAGPEPVVRGPVQGSVPGRLDPHAA